MSTVYAFERTPYVSEIQVQVLETGTEAGRDWAVLDDTVLYPGGGGQPPDQGRLGDARVTDVARVGGAIRHYLDRPTHTGRLRLFLDWERRFDHMQQHTAQHVITAVALDRFHWETTSFHLGAAVSDIELDVPSLSAEDLGVLERKVMEVVRAALPVRARRGSFEEYVRLDVRGRGLPDHHEGDVRLVEIQGVDVTTCGGTHLSSTAEIEAVKLLGSEPMRGGTRLHWVAGGRVRERLGEHEERNRALRGIVGTSDDELADAVGAKLDQLRETLKRAGALEAALADETATRLLASEGTLAEAHFEPGEPSFAQAVARAFAARGRGRVVFLTSIGEKGAFFVLAAGADAPLDVAEAGSEVAALLAGRGGGAGSFFQGRVGSLERRPDALAAVRAKT